MVGVAGGPVIRAVVLDVDGTVLRSDHTISPATREAVADVIGLGESPRRVRRLQGLSRQPKGRPRFRCHSHPRVAARVPALPDRRRTDRQTLEFGDPARPCPRRHPVR